MDSWNVFNDASLAPPPCARAPRARTRARHVYRTCTALMQAASTSCDLPAEPKDRGPRAAAREEEPPHSGARR